MVGFLLLFFLHSTITSKKQKWAKINPRLCRCAGMDSPRSPNSEFQHSEIIQFDGLDDPESPFNWSLMKK